MNTENFHQVVFVRDLLTLHAILRHRDRLQNLFVLLPCLRVLRGVQGLGLGWGGGAGRAGGGLLLCIDFTL